MGRSKHVNHVAVLKNGEKLTTTRKDGIFPQSLVQRFLAKFPADYALCSESFGHATDDTIRTRVKCKINLLLFLARLVFIFKVAVLFMKV